MNLNKPMVVLSMLLICLLMVPSLGWAKEDQGPRHSPGVRTVEHSPTVFRPDPAYGDQVYDAKQQWLIYGGKRKVVTPRPLLELGRKFLTGGPYKPGAPTHLIVYGDVKTPSTFAIEDKKNAEPTFVSALQLNLEFDFKITSTERLHALIQPFQSVINGALETTRVQFGRNDPAQNIKTDDDGLQLVHIYQRCTDKKNNGGESCDALDMIDELGTFFFEGDLGSMLSIDADIPIALGKIPVIFQNGIWVEDAFLGGAFGIPARNSPTFDISNMDWVIFGGFDGVNSRAGTFIDPDPNVDPNTELNHKLALAGTSLFVEANQGYWEMGYAYVFDREADEKADLSYHNATVSFTRRYWGRLANSLRVVGNFLQEDALSANGVAVLMENSLVTSLPSTLIPYFNFFGGVGQVHPLARGAGLLRNTGLVYEADAVTLLPSLNDDVHDSVGGAIGVAYLFDLRQQLVVEVAGSFGLCESGDDGILEDTQCARRGAQDEFAAGLRHQIPFAHAWLLRTDAIFGLKVPPEGGAFTVAGGRIELRRKF